jgi:hypothetical protein
MDVLSAAHKGMQQGVKTLKYNLTMELPTTTSGTIEAALKRGFIPDRTGTNKGLTRLYLCHSCKGKHMIKARKAGTTWAACKCGYRKRVSA